MNGLTVQERDVLAELMASAVVPRLTEAVRHRDAVAVEELLSGLEWQDLAALVVVLAEEVTHEELMARLERERVSDPDALEDERYAPPPAERGYWNRPTINEQDND